MVVLSTKRVHETLMRYFATLTQVGYVSDSASRRILVMMFLNEMINSDMSFFVDDKDYNILARAVRIITGDCLMPYGNYCDNKLRLGLYGAHVGSPMLLDTAINVNVRHTQQDDARYAETSETRMTAGVIK